MEVNANLQDDGAPTPEQFGVRIPDQGVPRGTEDSRGEDDETPAPQHQDEGAGTESREQYEARVAEENEARKFGWKDAESWKKSHGGTLEGWNPPKDYLDINKHVQSLRNNELKELRAEIALFKAREAARDKAAAEATARIETSTVEAELARAFDEGDRQKQFDLTNKLIDLRVQNAVKTAPQAQQPTNGQPQLPPEVQRAFRNFGEQNPVFRENQHIARSFGRELVNVYQTGTYDGTIDGLISEAAREVRARFPSAFQRQQAPYMGDSGGTTTGRGYNGSGGKTWSNLKPEYREQAERDIANGKYKQEDYMRQVLSDRNPNEYFRN